MTGKFEHQNPDARYWAKEFCKIHPSMDEEIMRAWFANAIMCGWDNHYWTTDEYKKSISDVLEKPKPKLVRKNLRGWLNRNNGDLDLRWLNRSDGEWRHPALDADGNQLEKTVFVEEWNT